MAAHLTRYNIRATEAKWRKLWTAQGHPLPCPLPLPIGPVADLNALRAVIATDALAGFSTLPAAISNRRNAGDLTPATVIDAYGIDATRLWVLSDMAPDRPRDWNNDAGLMGAWRFIHRLHRLASLSGESHGPALSPAPVLADQVALALRRAAPHQAIARLRQFTRTLEGRQRAGDGSVHADLGWLARCLTPIAPHIAQEIWQMLGHTTLLADLPWPTHSVSPPASLAIPIQVNGRLRTILHVPVAFAPAALQDMALGHDRVQRAIAGRPITRVIVIPDKIINVVTK
ncbi:MAG: class I tRNA ligase family protein [Pseudomonadota bacterium]